MKYKGIVHILGKRGSIFPVIGEVCLCVQVSTFMNKLIYNQELLNWKKVSIFKKTIFTSLLFLLLTVLPWISVSASDVVYEHYTYVNDFHKNSSLPTYNAARMSVNESYASTILFNDTYVGAGVDLLAGMLEREECVVVGYQTSNINTEDDFVDIIFREAVRHRGISNAGDYLMNNISGYSCDYTYTEYDSVRYYTLYYQPQYYTTAEQEAELAAEIDRILAQMDLANANEFERSTIIYDYICANVVYDYENLNDDSYDLKFTAYAALMNGTAVCQGYASLYYRMALEAGLDARVITGYGNDERHAWNIVKIGNLYYNLDATWDAENSPSYDNYQYYLRCDAQFPDHQRDPEMLTEEYLTTYPMNPENYVVSYATGTCGDALIWRYDNDGTLTISGNGRMYDYGYISEDGSGITYYDKPWESYGTLKRIIIEKGVASIGFAAFHGQNQLEQIEFHNSSVTEIGMYAFANTHIENAIVFPDSLRSIGAYAFDCSSFPNIDFFGDYIESIGSSAFSQCSFITEIAFPKSLKSIGSQAFYECSSLKKVSFAGSPPEIGNIAFNSTSPDLAFTYFEGTAGWTTPTWIAPDGTVYNTVVEGAAEAPANLVDSGECGENLTWKLYDNGLLKINGTGDMTAWYSSDSPWSSYCNSITKVVIGEGVTSIGRMAFMYCSLLWDAEIPDSVVRIEANAFDSCESLRQIILPHCLESIDAEAFYGCGLTEITLPSGVRELAFDAFRACDGLTTIKVEPYSLYFSVVDGVLFNKNKTILLTYPSGKTALSYTVPSHVTEIGINAFAYSEYLSDISISENVVRIGGGAFSNGKVLTNVNIPDSVISLGDNVFAYCEALTEIRIPNGVKTIGEYTFNGCINLESVHIGSGLETIGTGSFIGCNNLQQIEVHEDNVMFSSDEFGVLFDRNKTVLYQYPIGRQASSYCIPETVTVIRPFSFMYASALEQVTLPKTLQYLGQEAFSYTNLREIDIPGSVTFFDNAFSHCASLTHVVIRKHNSDVYAFIRETLGLFAGCDSLTSFEVEKGHIAMQSIDGVLYDSEGVSLIQYPPGRRDPQYRIADGCQIIEGYSFSGAVYLEHVIIPDSVSIIDTAAFEYCEKLSQVDIGSNVSVIEELTFLGCRSLKQITLPESLSTLGGNVFGDNYDLISASPLERICFLGDLPEFMDPWVFANMPDWVVLCVPENSVGWTTPTWTAGNGTVYNTVIHGKVPGDANGDCSVNEADSMLLSQYFTGCNVEINDSNADVDADGALSRRDAMILARYVAGWDGYESLPYMD